MQQYKPPLSGRSNFKGILLDFNECTIPVSSVVSNALKTFVDSAKLGIYPEYEQALKAVAYYAGVNQNQLLLTNGSDEAIDLVFRAFTSEGDKVIIPAPSFVMFNQYAQSVGNVVLQPCYTENVGVPQGENGFVVTKVTLADSGLKLQFPLDEVLQSIDKTVKLIVICNPNNPTGTLISLENIGKILDKAKNSMVLVDEAYFEFSGLSAVSLLQKYKNLIITRTFSKAFALAGLRVGYLLSCEENISELQKIISPYSVNSMAACALVAALKDIPYMKSYVSEVMQKSKPLVENFFRENGIKFFESSANFILFKPENPADLVAKMANAGFLLRPRSGPNIDGTVRVSLGTLSQMRAFIRAFQIYLTQ